MAEQPFPHPINGTEQRLDAILAELRAQRAERQRPEPAADGTVELRESDRPKRRRG